MAGDMLRWWDGSNWSETEFKLARTMITTEVRRDFLLGPLGRRGSVLSVVFCSALVVVGIVFALTMHPFLWGIVAVCGFLDVIFIVMASAVHHFDVPATIQRLIWPSEES
ncbi:hypothetical protein BJY17_000651 [Agromyces hippuratus]|uniref:DUF2510 domain-containing protein n=2 Tax=Agromyces hippuratus TaxID=286438 RepID=A0A852WXV3_9MICO|nr:hypothetical protein [Agromyces hippuratus]NYG19904.1 hypothetical protein [Agromyces hippuratus]